jgi:flagellar hook-associated protein 2
VTDLKDWINKIAINNGENISANIVQTTSTSYALVIAGKSTGVSNSIGFTGLNGYSVITSNGTSVSSSNVTLNSVNENSGNIVSVNSTARDALLQINGLSFQKSSNTITDAVANISFNLLSPVLPGGVTNSALISVGDGADSSSTIIQDLVTSYNGFIAQYKEMVANSQNTTNGKIGSLSNRQGLLPFIGDIKNKVSIGALAADSSSLSLVTMGIDLQTDGTMKFNSSNYNQGIATGLLAKLRAGISVGGVAGSSVNLSTVLSSTINPGGTISSTIAGQTNLISASQSRIDNLKIQLSLLEKSYVSQYSRLNTLLFNLGQTSSQLTSALTAVTNINSRKT